MIQRDLKGEEGREKREGNHWVKTKNKTKPKSWDIYTFKSCCLILQQIRGEMMRCSQPSIRSEPLLAGMGSEAGGGNRSDDIT